MRRDPPAKRGPMTIRLDLDRLQKHFDRPEVAVVFVFGSMADESSHALSDVDLAYLGTTGEAEDRVFDELYEMLQRELKEGRFDLVPLRRAPLHLQFAVATAGRLLYVRDPIVAEGFGTRAISRYLDFKPCRDRYFGTGG